MRRNSHWVQAQNDLSDHLKTHHMHELRHWVGNLETVIPRESFVYFEKYRETALWINQKLSEANLCHLWMDFFQSWLGWGIEKWFQLRIGSNWTIPSEMYALSVLHNDTLIFLPAQSFLVFLKCCIAVHLHLTLCDNSDLQPWGSI